MAYEADGKRIVASLSLPITRDVTARTSEKLDGMSIALFSGTQPFSACDDILDCPRLSWLTFVEKGSAIQIRKIQNAAQSG